MLKLHVCTTELFAVRVSKNCGQIGSSCALLHDWLVTISLHMVTIKRNSKGVLCKGVRSSGVRYAYYAKLLDTLIVDFEMNCSEIQHALEHTRLRLAHDFVNWGI